MEADAVGDCDGFVKLAALSGIGAIGYLVTHSPVFQDIVSKQLSWTEKVNAHAAELPHTKTSVIR